MPIGDPVELFRLNDENELKAFFRGHLLKSNKTRSSEYTEVGGEQGQAYVTFTLRWHKLLSEVEFHMPDFRLRWRGQMFDVVGFDDYMMQHKKIDLSCRSLGSDYCIFASDEGDADG